MNALKPMKPFRTDHYLRLLVAGALALALTSCTASENGGGDSPSRTDVQKQNRVTTSFTFEKLQPLTNYQVAPCVEGVVTGSESNEFCSLRHSIVVKTSPHGKLSGELPVSSTVMIPITSEDEYSPLKEEDCITDGQCLIAVIGKGQFVDALGDPYVNPDAPPRPSLTIGAMTRSTSGSDDAHVVGVSGDGFPSGRKIDIVQCPSSGDHQTVDSAECLYNKGGSFSSDDAGKITGDMVVERKFTKNNGTVVDCSQLEACILAYAWPDLDSRYTQVPLHLDNPK